VTRAARVRVAGAADHAALSRFLESFPWQGLGDRSWADRLRHFWEDNPAFDATWERGWIVEAEDQIVGFLGSVPRRVLLNGKRALSANATSWWVAPEYRRHSLQQLAHFIKQKAACHFNTTPSPTVLELIEAFRLTPFPGQAWLRESLLFIEPQLYLSHRLYARIPALPAKSIFDRLTRPLARGASALQRLRFPSRRRYRWEALSRADDRFAELSLQLGNRHRLTAERDPASLNWLLSGERAQDKQLIACVEGTRLVGYALLVERDSGGTPGLTVLDCIDLARANDDPAVVATLLDGIMATGRARSVALAVLRHYDEALAATLRRLGLIARGGPPRREHVSLPKGLDPQDTYLTQLHGDYFI
jgi:hypothetical protein